MFLPSLCRKAVFLLAVATSTGAASDWTIYLRRAGPVRIGMPLDAVRRTLGDPSARLEANPGEPSDECAYLRSRAIPEGLAFMFGKGRVVRVDVLSAGIRTASGVGVGDSEDKVKRVYPGRIKVAPHKYLDDAGHYLNYSPADAADRGYGMVFETDKGTVTSFRIGTSEAVALVEGCS